MRVCGALHGLARSNNDPAVHALYANTAGNLNADDAWRVIRGALERHSSYFATYLATAPQTNEVGRSAALICGFLEIAKRFALPLCLFESGASAGLNLIADRYRYRFGEVQWGDPRALLFLEPKWEGPAPPVRADLRVAERRGCDIAPVDITVASERTRLSSYVWPDQPDRLLRLEMATQTALRDPPRLERMEAADWVEQRITESPDQRGRVRVLFHSVVWGYFPVATQRRIEKHMERCGSHAETDAPLAWLRFELANTAPSAALTLRLWPTGDELVLAYAHPHGTFITYLA